MSLPRLALAAWFVLAASCTPMPTIQHDVCGNAIIDPGEDCDTFPIGDSECRAPGEAAACHLDCSKSSEGERGACPEGWGCSIAGICQHPTAGFDEPVTFETGSDLTLLSGDFDGDGRSDLVGQEQLDAVQRTRLRFHYFDETGRRSDTRAFPKVLTAPVVAELSQDERSDVLFSDPRLGLLLGSDDRSWVPEAFGSYRVQDHPLLMFQLTIYEGAPVVAVSTLEDVTGLFIPIEEEGELRRVLTLPKGVEALVGPPATGNVIEGDLLSPCNEAALAYRGATSFSLIDLCFREDSTARIKFRVPATETHIALDPPARIDHAPQLVDFNLDGHLDALIGAGGITYLALGDGNGLGVAKPYVWRWTEIIEPTSDHPRMLMPHDDMEEMPLAVGDLSADGVIDFVFSDRLMVSLPGSGGDHPVYRRDNETFGAPWTEAKVGDLNRDGKLDAVAVSATRLDIDFFNGTNSEHLPHVSIATESPVSHLGLCDFDGDGVDDVAFAEQAHEADEPDLVQIAFGNPAGAPSEPKRIARIESIEQVAPLRTPSICTLMVTSLVQHDDQKAGVLTLFDGSADRIPLAPYNITNFSEEAGGIQARAVLALTAGAFVAPDGRDVLALVTPSDSRQSEPTWEFWLVPSIDTPDSVAVKLQATLADTDLEPATIMNHDLGSVSLASGSADLDGDGLSEALFAMPTRDGQRCGVVTLGERDAHFTDRRITFLNQPCPQPLLGAADANGDGAPDIALLLGARDSAERQLVVLWNNGTGDFSAEAVNVVNDPGDAPRQFAFLPKSPGVREFSIAYVTKSAVKLSERLADTSHDFLAPAPVPVPSGGSGLASGDFDGDGIIDLALAWPHSISVLKAKLEAPR